MTDTPEKITKNDGHIPDGYALVPIQAQSLDGDALQQVMEEYLPEEIFLPRQMQALINGLWSRLVCEWRTEKPHVEGGGTYDAASDKEVLRAKETAWIKADLDYQTRVVGYMKNSSRKLHDLHKEALAKECEQRVRAGNLAESIRELVAAMREYEMDVDGTAPAKHVAMIEKAERRADAIAVSSDSTEPVAMFYGDRFNRREGVEIPEMSRLYLAPSENELTERVKQLEQKAEYWRAQFNAALAEVTDLNAKSAWKDCQSVLDAAGDPAAARPSDCRLRLMVEGKAYPRSGCNHCNDGGLRGCPYGELIDDEIPTKCPYCKGTGLHPEH